MRAVLVLLAAIALMAATPLPTKVRLQIEISIAGDHLQAHFHTDQPVADIVMDDRMDADGKALARPVRLKQWRPVGPGWLPYDERLARTDGKLFQDADLDIFPDDKPLLWIFPILFPAGGGFALHSRYLLGDQQRFDTTLLFRPAAGQTVDFGAASATVNGLVSRDFSREVYLGPESSVMTEAGIHVVAAKNVPVWLRHRAADSLKRSLVFYGDGLGQAVPWSPTLIFARLPETDNWEAFAQPVSGGVVTDRLFGPDFDVERESTRSSSNHTIAHEAFHLWNGVIAHQRNGRKAPWLVEGSADYASLLARRAAGEFSDAEWYREFDRTLATCRTELGHGGLGQFTGIVRHHSAYNCGFVIQWIADLAAQHASHQQRGFFDLWRALMSKAKASPDASYSVEDFRAWVAANDPAALTVIDLLIQPDRGDRWVRLRKLLESYGVVTGPALQSEREARIALFNHMLSQDCAGRVTWHLRESSLRLFLTIDQGACQHFKKVNDFIEIEGHSPISDIYGVYAAVLQKCNESRTVGLTLGDGSSLGMVCSRKLGWLAASPPDFVVRGLP